MSRKGADFGYMAKRHGTLAQRREQERRRKAAEAINRRMAAFDLDMELAKFERDQMRVSRRDSRE